MGIISIPMIIFQMLFLPLFLSHHKIQIWVAAKVRKPHSSSMKLSVLGEKYKKLSSVFRAGGTTQR